MPMRSLYLCICFCLIANKENEMRHLSDGCSCISSALIAVFLLLKLSLCKLRLHNICTGNLSESSVKRKIGK